MSKMFWSPLFVILMLCSTFTAGSISKSAANGFALHKIELAFLARCLKNEDIFAAFHLKAASIHFSFCMLENLKRSNNDEEIINMLCTTLSQDGYNCMGNVLEKLDPCLNLQEKYLPEFLVSIHNSALDYECKNDGRKLRNFMSTARSAECDYPLEYIQELLVENCFFTNPLLKNLVDSDYVLRKSDLCIGLEIARYCIIEEVQSYCDDNTNLMKMLATHMDQFLNPCDNSTSENVIY